LLYPIDYSKTDLKQKLSDVKEVLRIQGSSRDFERLGKQALDGIDGESYGFAKCIGTFTRLELGLALRSSGEHWKHALLLALARILLAGLRESDPSLRLSGEVEARNFDILASDLAKIAGIQRLPRPQPLTGESSLSSVSTNVQYNTSRVHHTLLAFDHLAATIDGMEFGSIWDDKPLLSGDDIQTVSGSHYRYASYALCLV